MYSCWLIKSYTLEAENADFHFVDWPSAPFASKGRIITMITMLEIAICSNVFYLFDKAWISMYDVCTHIIIAACWINYLQSQAFFCEYILSLQLNLSFFTM